MKKVLVLFATMVMSFALAITVMANDSPSKETDSTEKDYTDAQGCQRPQNRPGHR